MTDIKYKMEDEKYVLHYSHDVQPLLDANAKERALGGGAFEKKGEFRKVMRIDTVTLMDICLKYHLDFFKPEDCKVIMKILKGEEYKKFRTVNDVNL